MPCPRVRRPVVTVTLFFHGTRTRFTKGGLLVPGVDTGQDNHAYPDVFPPGCGG